jgi:hypothetical protein
MIACTPSAKIAQRPTAIWETVTPTRDRCFANIQPQNRPGTKAATQNQKPIYECADEYSRLETTIAFQLMWPGGVGMKFCSVPWRPARDQFLHRRMDEVGEYREEIEAKIEGTAGKQSGGIKQRSVRHRRRPSRQGQLEGEQKK